MRSKVVAQSWNLERTVLTIADGKLVLRARNRGKDIELTIPDPGWAEALGPPSVTRAEGSM